MRQPSKLVAASVLLLVAVIGPPAAAAAGMAVETVAGGRGQVNWTTGSITVKGSGAPPERGSPAQQRLLAGRAAVADGYRQLAEIVNGVRVDSETVVRDMVVESDVIRTQVSATLKGARQGAPRYLSDGAVEVDVQLPLYGAGGVADAIDLDRQVGPARTSLLPTFDLGHWRSAAAGTYTGVVVDCRQVALQPAMSPGILDEAGNELYVGNLSVDADLVVNEGIAGYRTDLNDALASESRVGTRPLVVQALRADGNFHADAVLSQHDAETLKTADRAGRFLAQTKVVFVIRRP